MALISDNPFLKDLGFELLDMKDGIAEVGINLQAQHMNSWQVMHGGHHHDPARRCHGACRALACA